ncbi:MAG: DUF262 domain-containing protein [Aurantimicrobium sp.]|nr:DUF262 domain-containing protein [Aurantimicrobium sp.]
MGIAQHSRLESYKLGALAEATKPDGDGKVLIRIPKYQRGIVWSTVQQMSLLESIFKGFPIGSILCHDNRLSVGEGDKKRDVWELVDGLQRTTTLLKFIERPLDLIPADGLISAETKSIVLAYLGLASVDTGPMDFDKELEKWCRGVGTTLGQDGFTGWKLLAHMQTAFSVEPHASDEIRTYFDTVIDEITAQVNAIKEIELPVLVYSGPGSEVPEIFRLVNSTGTKLTKYQVFAATWASRRTRISNKEIQKAVKERYQAYLDEGYEVQDFKENIEIKEDEYNLYEYLYGLGHIICNHKDFGKLFPDPDSNPDDAAATAFNLVTVASGLHIPEMAHLAELLSNQVGPDEAIDMSALEKAILRSCADVYSLLKPILGLKLNATSGDGKYKGHSLNQILSLVIRYLLESHERGTWALKPGPSLAALKKHIPNYYLYDIVAANWRSAGEKRYFDNVWSIEQVPGLDKTVLAPSPTYVSSIPAERWESALGLWFDDQLSKRQVIRPNVTEAQKVFMKFLYAQIVTFYDNHAVDFELEHLMPVKVLTQAIADAGDGEGWPISNVGNLCLLPKPINRIKAETLLGDYLASNDTDLSPEQVSALGQYVISPSPEEVTKPTTFSREWYEEFCKERFSRQVELIVKWAT